jgi:hypothetical protein
MKKNFHTKQLNAQGNYSFFSPLFFYKLPIHFLKLIALFFIIATASCNKMDVLAPVKDVIEDQGFRSLVVSDEFTWAATKSITLEIIPLQTDSDLSTTLYVKTLNDNTLLTYNTSMQQGLQLKFDLPTDETKVKIVYGAIEKIIDVTGNKIAFDFISPIPAQYE